MVAATLVAAQRHSFAASLQPVAVDRCMKPAECLVALVSHWDVVEPTAAAMIVKAYSDSGGAVA